jgi:hypothetical protein
MANARICKLIGNLIVEEVIRETAMSVSYFEVIKLAECGLRGCFLASSCINEFAIKVS